jgi:16S rRNA processing protein RimM
MELLKVGLIKKPHGIRGELKVLPLTDHPSRFKQIRKFYLENHPEWKFLTVASVKLTANDVIIKFDEISTPEKALNVQSCYLFIDKADGEVLKEWEYYSQDLVGCRIIFQDKDYGTVIDLDNWGANDNLRVLFENQEYFYPFLRQFIDRVDLAEKKIYINEIEGFLNS